MIAAFALALFGITTQSKPLDVIARIPPGAYVAGQAIEIRLGVVAEGERPEVTPPKVPAVKADLILVEQDFRQVGVSGIGDLVRESNLYIERYLVIPKRPGTLEIPAFQAALGDRRGASKPLRVEVQPVPGPRPATFLGGVGGLELRAVLSADRVRVGETIEYALTLEGPGSRASVDRPALAQAKARHPSLEINASRDDLVPNPPSRTFRWTLRPAEPGQYTMPPVLISTYNARTRRFDTRSSPSVSFLVADVPRFDESTFRYGANEEPEPSEDDREVEVVSAPAVLGMLGLAGGSGAILLARWIRRIRHPIARARRVARKGLHELGRVNIQDVPGWTMQLIESLVTLDPNATGHAGTLDPRGVESSLASAGLPASLASGVADLLARCESVSYGEKGPPGALSDEIGRILKEIAALPVRLPTPDPTAPGIAP